ncbi:SH3 domain-binding protein 1 [Protobothrops mucrosquamatus]|uniref:SH3 domain-binding protein 1 n=1 Tax=Protobothrops mucrosquamatus TaxID=103944 RepID=UPI0007759294|nr:SH3 domain-binding protein 1 [Protobothrops mucrosquamatus]
MMKRQFNRMRQQLSYPSITGRAQETADYLTEDLLQTEQRIEPVKRAAHNVHKRLVACLQGQYGAELDKRVKKLPLMALSVTMAESFKELDMDSSLGKALEMSCCIQSTLARILAEFEITLEQDVLQPLNKLSEEELPVILKHKKNLQKLILDWNIIKSRLNQVAKNSSNSVSAVTTSGASSAALKLENLKEEEEEMKRRVEQSKDEYMADLYHFSTKEDSYAKYFIKLLEIQAEYHQKSLESLNSTLAELMSSQNESDAPFPLDAAVPGVYGMPLETHLKASEREIALPIEACVMMLLSTGMREEGLFRLAAGASVLKKLKYCLDSGSNIPDEFYVDPHAVAGALKCYLRELPQPLMISELYDDWLKAASAKEPDIRLEGLKDVCNLLPKDNYNNLRYLIRFLAMLAEQQEVNKMSPSNIAIVLGPNLLWPQQNESYQLFSKEPPRHFIKLCVERHHDINFDVSSLFTPPLDIKNQNILTIEEPSAVFLPSESNSPMPEERKKSEVIPETVSSKVTESSTETTICPPTSASADETSRKTKRVAPPRPTMPPPHPQTTPLVHLHMPPPSPESVSIPKALPRRTVGGPARAPVMAPPLPPQPARRQSHKAPPSPRPPSEAMNNKAATAEEDSTNVCSRETPKDSIHTKKEANEGKISSPSAAAQKVETLENLLEYSLPTGGFLKVARIASMEENGISILHYLKRCTILFSTGVTYMRRALFKSDDDNDNNEEDRHTYSPSRERRASDWLRRRQEDGGRGGECGSSMAGCRRLSGACLREVLGEAQGLLFDCDGVLWTGDRAVPGAPELLERLNLNGKTTLFVSNNSRRSVAELERRFSRLGFRGVRGEQVFSSALCSALYLRQRLLGGEAGAGDSSPGRVFVLGGEGLRGELRDAGLRLTGEEGEEEEEEGEGDGEALPVRAVVVGYDDQFTFAKLSEACAYLRDPRCLLVATDPDPWHPLSSGQRTPGTGSLTAAVETASGRKATVIGKPNTYMFECIVERFGVDPSRMLMVGDRLETDILFGKNCGLDTVLTLTGVSYLEEAQAYMASDSPSAKDLVPHYYVDSIADLIPGLDE